MKTNTSQAKVCTGAERLSESAQTDMRAKIGIGAKKTRMAKGA